MDLIALPAVLAAYASTNWLPGNRTLAHVRRSGWARRFPFARVDAAVRLSASSAALVVVAAGLCLAVPSVGGRLVADNVSPFVVLLGVPLGLGVAGVSSLACLVAAQAMGPSASGGWSRQVRLAAMVLPRPVTVAVVGGYTAAEEVLLRGVLISVALPAGPVVALTLSVLVALAVQVFPWTDWRSVLFPVLGTAVTATVHGLLFLVIADIRPLVVAHLTHLAVSLSATQK
jgi:hypothetical protein